jgi:oxygen-dependent protoporphyrinogen oxidase
MVVGIFGGDIRKISIRACFPKFKAWEEHYGSITKGFFEQRKKKRGESKFSPDIEEIPLSAIFSFRRGIEQLPHSIVKQLSAKLYCHQEVTSISLEKDCVSVKTEKEQFSADFLFCALPIKEAACLFAGHVPEISKEFLKVPSESIGVVNFGYDAHVLPVQGFGYLTPTYAHEDILGVVFDSSLFSIHNRSGQETRLTIKLADSGCSEEKYVAAALKGIRTHLGISRLPKAISFKHALRAIPQYGVGHLEKMAELKARFRRTLPNCQLVGSYLQGVSVDACIERAKEAVGEWLTTFTREGEGSF